MLNVIKALLVASVMRNDNKQLYIAIGLQSPHSEYSTNQKDVAILEVGPMSRFKIHLRHLREFA